MKKVPDIPSQDSTKNGNSLLRQTYLFHVFLRVVFQFKKHQTNKEVSEIKNKNHWNYQKIFKKIFKFWKKKQTIVKKKFSQDN